MWLTEALEFQLTGVCLITYFINFFGYLYIKKFKYSILRDFNLVIRQPDGQAVCGVAASFGVACFLNGDNKDNFVIESDVLRNQKT